MFVDDRTITEVIGIPPSNPLLIFPIPCASSSLSGEEIRFKGSKESVASNDNKDSKEATMAKVMATEYTLGFVIKLQSGETKPLKISLLEAKMGKLTMWSLESPKNQSGAYRPNNSLIPTPANTTKREAGKAFIQENFWPNFVQENKITSPRREIISAPILMEASDFRISVKVFSPSFWSNSNSPIKSKSSPIACGICFKIMTIPIATSIPRITEEGKKPPIFPIFKSPYFA